MIKQGANRKLTKKAKTKIPNIIFPKHISTVHEQTGECKMAGTEKKIGFQLHRHSRALNKSHSVKQNYDQRIDQFESLLLLNEDRKQKRLRTTLIQKNVNRSLNRSKSHGFTLHFKNTNDKQSDRNEGGICQQVRKKNSKSRSLFSKEAGEWAKSVSMERKKEHSLTHKFDNVKINRQYDHLGRLQVQKFKKKVTIQDLSNCLNFEHDTDADLFREKAVLLKKRVTHQKSHHMFERSVFNNGTAIEAPFERQAVERPINQKKERKKFIRLIKKDKDQEGLINTGQKGSHFGLNHKKLPKSRFSAKVQNAGFVKKGEVEIGRGIENREGPQDIKYSFMSDYDEIESGLKHLLIEKSSAAESSDHKTKEFNSRSQKALVQQPRQDIIEKESEDQSFETKRRRLSVSKGTLKLNSDIRLSQKVYFVPVRLSCGSIAVFVIEKVNFKCVSSKEHTFCLEVVIQAFEQILLQKIQYRKQSEENLCIASKETQKKDQLKGRIFQELIETFEKIQNRESVAEQLIINSQKHELQQLQNENRLSLGESDPLNQFRERPNPNSIGSAECSPIDLGQISQECYKSIIAYIQEFCQYEVSYLGASLKESKESIPSLLNNVMRKKHSQMQETLLQGLNLAQVLYFLIKINSTYYVTKSVLMQKKVRYFVLYEFSNLIRHTQSCIIEEEQIVPEYVMSLSLKSRTDYLYRQITFYFANQKGNNQINSQIMNRVYLLNALELCYGTIKKIGHQAALHSQRLFRVTEINNYNNSAKWKSLSFVFNKGLEEQGETGTFCNFFQHHLSFDLGLLQDKKVEFKGFNSFIERNALQKRFEYMFNKKFELNIWSPTRNLTVLIHKQFQRQQLLLLHLENEKEQILKSFLRKNIIQGLLKKSQKNYNHELRTRPFFTSIGKGGQYCFEVYETKKSSSAFCEESVPAFLNSVFLIRITSLKTFKRHMIKLTFGEVLQEVKECYRLCSDSKGQQKYIESLHSLYASGAAPREQIVRNLKTFIEKLRLVRKNNYSQFFFIPDSRFLPNIRKALASDMLFQQSHELNNSSVLSESNSQLMNSALIHSIMASYSSRESKRTVKSLLLLQDIKIKHFPHSEIFHKCVKKLFSGIYCIVTISSMTLFDLFEIKVYVSKLHKSFFLSIKPIENPKQISGFLKETFLKDLIAKQSHKISCKNQDFYYRMINGAESPFISAARRKKEGRGDLARRRLKPNSSRLYKTNSIEVSEVSEEILAKVFQSERRLNKYLVRISHLPSREYVDESERRGIDEKITVSVYKQNSVLIYRFSTTARKLLSKKVTHTFNVIQLAYQERNKPFYILFEEIKRLIESCDESTYGLLNTFKSYFLDKHYNSLATNQMVSILSANMLFAGFSDNNLNSRASINTSGNFLAVPSSKNIGRIKDANSNRYQRYCLFVKGTRILEVLQIRKEFRENTDKSRQDGTSLKNQLEKGVHHSQDQKFKTTKNDRNGKTTPKRQRRNSIDEFLTEETKVLGLNKDSYVIKTSCQPSEKFDVKANQLTNSVSADKKCKAKSALKRQKNRDSLCVPTQGGFNLKMKCKPSFEDRVNERSACLAKGSNKNKIIFAERDCSNGQPFEGENTDGNEKIVYYIDSREESLREITSTTEDQKFCVNLKFSQYNRRMFKRFFRDLVLKDSAGFESEEEQSVPSADPKEGTQESVPFPINRSDSIEQETVDLNEEQVSRLNFSGFSVSDSMDRL